MAGVTPEEIRPGVLVFWSGLFELRADIGRVISGPVFGHDEVHQYVWVMRESDHRQVSVGLERLTLIAEPTQK